jgi:predicted nucleotidyltransferase
VSDAFERPLDLRELLTVLAEHGVDYLVIGGVAAQVHGRRRTTRDLDVTPAPTAEQLRIAPIVPPLSTRHGELHILNTVPGASPYAEMRARALTTDLDGIPVSIVGVDDLIRMKQTTGRPGDIEDIEAITSVERSESRGDGPQRSASSS